jgi:hypothetical protein
MSRFPTAGHLVAWAGLCPGQNESAGKRKSSRLRKGAPWLQTALVQCAVSAVAASMLTAIYHMLNDGTVHQDPGAGHFDRRSTDAKARRLVSQLTKLGFQVQLEPLAEAA